MDQERWAAEAFFSFRKLLYEEERIQDIISYIRSKSDLIKLTDVTSVLQTILWALTPVLACGVDL